MNDINNEENSNECGCGCDCNDIDNEEIEARMYLQLDDDTELECDVLAIFELDEKEYIVLLPVEEEEALIYQYILLDNDEVDLISIEDEKEFDKVAEAFHDIYLSEEE